MNVFLMHEKMSPIRFLNFFKFISLVCICLRYHASIPVNLLRYMKLGIGPFAIDFQLRHYPVFPYFKFKNRLVRSARSEILYGKSGNTSDCLDWKDFPTCQAGRLADWQQALNSYWLIHEPRIVSIKSSKQVHLICRGGETFITPISVLLKSKQMQM